MKSEVLDIVLDILDKNNNKIKPFEFTYRVLKLLTKKQLIDVVEGEKYKYDINDKKYLVADGKFTKICIGDDYNFIFDKRNGNFKRWGKTYDEDPQFSPIGPEIYDCEVTTICNGITQSNGKESPCAFCYKSNTINGKNLLFDDFKKMLDIFPKTLTQIAFGSDSKATSNPDLWKMMEYCREKGVIPNITVADISDEVADKLKEYCGAVAVSRYSNKDICYDSVKKLATNRRMKQINIHSLLSEETFDLCMETVKDMKNDKRLKNMNAIVFLGLKKKGRAKDNFNIVSLDKFDELISYCLNNNIRFGFDSCSAPRFEKFVKGKKDMFDSLRQQLLECSESCESGLFSFYTSVDGAYFPCSFTENENNWKDGISLLKSQDFLKDIWYSKKNNKWRENLLNTCKDGCRKCLTFPEINV